MALRYRRYRAYSFRIGRQASVRELELTAVIAFSVLIVYLVTRLNAATLWAVCIGFIVLGSVVGLISFKVFQRKARRFAKGLQTLQLVDIDNMEEAQFTEYIEMLLRARGYQTMQTAQTGTDGVAFIAQKGRKAVGVYIERQTDPVRAANIRRAASWRRHFGFHTVMIITNSTFTSAAKRTALSHSCALIDRGELAQWVLRFQEGN